MRLARMKSILDALEGSTFEQGPSFQRAEQLEAISRLKREIELAQVAMKLGQAIYEKQAQAEASPAAEGAAAEPAKEDVVDAEFSEVDDTKA